MQNGPRLILQVPRGSAVARRLSEQPPRFLASGEMVVEEPATDAAGHLNPPDVGEIVMSVPSPEGLRRQQDEVHRVIRRAGQGVQPVVLVVEAASELRDEELGPVIDAADRISRPVIVRIICDG